ncbi:pyridoxamine 5'-phosphate oxidase family protein [Pseudodesulfovibrio sp. zrk46]|uniref:pyridoxamine 5'-phosphate oxidase family protein n=1 Tax=Pseudodesulfovibrio sp. zrk46 TaxID=2725288 RepID=UPI001FFC95F6|nr:pyridoxamine 5'-phosphate oxidase family protein [Pseudodesulfovibrio sp. zrk46]
MSKDKMQIIDNLVLSKDLCVLATSDGIEPLASLMNYVVDHASMKFYFLSRKDSQKNKNIKSHPHVSILIDRRDEGLALTIQGVYSPIKTKQTSKAITKLILTKLPRLKQFAEHPDTELIRIQGKSAILMEGISDKFETKFNNS